MAKEITIVDQDGKVLVDFDKIEMNEPHVEAAILPYGDVPMISATFTFRDDMRTAEFSPGAIKQGDIINLTMMIKT